jgi:hypothetical protein
MSINYLNSRHPHLRYSLLAIFLFCYLTLAGARVYTKIDPQGVVESNNPHHIPNEFNPRLHHPEDEVIVIQEVAKKEAVASSETMHELALKNQTLTSQPIYDYTTGTTI